MTRGRLIAFEGGEACGKSTQAAILAQRLGAILTREPGGTALGERVRALLLEPDQPAPHHRAEALLMAAARAQHVAEVVRPALESGRTVVSDRFSHSSLAYQGFGRGLDVEELRRLTDWATEGLWPDVVVFIDLPPGRTLGSPGRPDRFERELEAFHRRVIEGFRALAAEESDRWRVVDGQGSVEEVSARVWSAVGPMVDEPAAPAGP